MITRDTGPRIRKPGVNSRETLSLKKILLIKETCNGSLATDFCDSQQWSQTVQMIHVAVLFQ